MVQYPGTPLPSSMPGWTLQHRDTATLEERRLRGLGLLSEGRSQAEVARWLGVTPAAVCCWKRAIEEGGPKAFRAVPRAGRPTLVPREQLAALPELLARERSPTDSPPTCGPSLGSFRSPWQSGESATPRPRCGACSSDTGSHGSAPDGRRARRIFGP